VILDWKSYEQIARDERYRDDLAAFWKTNTWVYVGCGVNGLSDPDFGLLLERYAERARQAGIGTTVWRVEKPSDRNFRRASIRSSSTSVLSRMARTIRTCQRISARCFLRPSSSRPRQPSLRHPSLRQLAQRWTPSPLAPALYAEPDYIGSHKFVGRDAELQTLSDWANRSDPTNLLLFEAIGGNGKSMLTWEWTTKHATSVRTGADGWAGRFWYSFYERGAIMQDFCQRALAYMTGRPLKEFEKRKTAEMKDELIAQLHAPTMAAHSRWPGARARRLPPHRRR